MADVITPEGKTWEIDDVSLASLQKTVGGYIELVRLHTGLIMYVNEDGRGLNLPFNRNASQLAHQDIVGTAVVLTFAETEKEDKS